MEGVLYFIDGMIAGWLLILFLAYMIDTIIKKKGGVLYYRSAIGSALDKIDMLIEEMIDKLKVQLPEIAILEGMRKDLRNMKELFEKVADVIAMREGEEYEEYPRI